MKTILLHAHTSIHLNFNTIIYILKQVEISIQFQQINFQ